VVYLLALIFVALLPGCATNHNAEERPFFQQEYDLESHGRKTILDRLVEFDPGRFHVDVAPGYLKDPPARIAVLPFTDEGSANFVVDKIALTYRDQKERYNWAWTDAQRLRRAMQGYLAQREFIVANLNGVDAVIEDHGIRNMAQLEGVPVSELGDWFNVDAVVYGKVVHYEAYYLALVAAWQVGIEIKVVSATNGRTLIRASGSRWDTSVLPALDLQDIAINSAENLLQLRDINLARAEEEACREIVKRIPRSDKLEMEMADEAREEAQRAEAGRHQAGSRSSFSSVIPGQSYPVILDRAVRTPGVQESTP
jgi:Putative bacterial lipoprotein (DUF799)